MRHKGPFIYYWREGDGSKIGRATKIIERSEGVYENKVNDITGGSTKKKLHPAEFAQISLIILSRAMEAGSPVKPGAAASTRHGP